MNRRSFLSSIATAVAGFTVLPPATTYDRVWKATRPWKVIECGSPVCEYAFDPVKFMGSWHWVWKDEPCTVYIGDTLPKPRLVKT